METNEIIAWIFILFNVVCYYLRDISPFNKIWFVLKCFWLALAAVLIYNNIKERIKK
jgi:hypothetical protein